MADRRGRERAIAYDAGVAPQPAPLADRLVRREPRIAVLIPCHNEEGSIEKVVRDFTAAVPEAEIYVYDNNSTDRTAEVAAAAGAIVRRETRQGKGNVVRRMFADIEADIYVMVDGDATYDPQSAPQLIDALIADGLDMVAGARVTEDSAAYRSGHRFGNRMLSGLVRRVFGRQFQDMLTGYRVFSRRFVKSFPAHSAGFEIETELTIHTLQLRLPSLEVDVAYGARLEGSESKLNTLGDGVRILRMIGLLVREEKPMLFFGLIGLLSTALSIPMFVRVVIDYARTQMVPHFPTLIVGVGLAVLGLLSIACGLILDSVSRARLEQRRLAYLAVPPLPRLPARLRTGDARAKVRATSSDHAFVVLAHGESPFLAGCLDTLTRQTRPSRILITTSTPNDLIAGEARRVGAQLIVNPRREGIGADWNFGLRVSDARYVTLVHQDDTYHPQFLARSLEMLRRHKGALCFTSYQEVDDAGLPSSSKISKVKHLIEMSTLGPLQRIPGVCMRAFLAFGAPLPCSSVTYDMTRMGDFEFSRAYSANLDWDAWLRIIDLRLPFVRCPVRLVGRRHNPLTATSQLIANGCRRREDLQLFRRIWPRPLADAIAFAYRAGY